MAIRVARYIKNKFEEYEWGVTDCISFAEELLSYWTYEDWDIRPSWAKGSYKEAMLATKQDGLLETYKRELLACRSVTGDKLIHSTEPNAEEPSLFILSPNDSTGRKYIQGIRIKDKFQPMLGCYKGTDNRGIRYGTILTREGLSQVSGFTLSYDFYTPESLIA